MSTAAQLRSVSATHQDRTIPFWLWTRASLSCGCCGGDVWAASGGRRAGGDGASGNGGRVVEEEELGRDGES